MQSFGKTLVYLMMMALLSLMLWAMLRSLAHHPGRPTLLGLLNGAGQYTLLVAGVFGFLGLALPVHRLLPTRYYNSIDEARLGRLYRTLRVEWVRQLICALHYHRPGPRQAFFGGRRADFQQQLTNTQGAECGHLLALVAQLVLLLYFLCFGRYDLALGAAVGNLLGNFYPVLLQRRHRARLLRLGGVAPAAPRAFSLSPG
jgi:hypothetical protein